MKRLFTLVLAWLMTSLATAQSIPDQQVSLSYEDSTIESILSDISKNYDLQFSYGNLDLDKKIDFNHDGSLENGIAKLCEKNSLVFKSIGGQLVLKKDIPIGQPIKGMIIDLDSNTPLIGANVVVLNSEPLIGGSTDLDGNFRLENLKVGRYDIAVEYLGYEPRVIRQIQVTTGKQVFLNVELKESTVKMEEVVILAKQDTDKPLNDMATTSSRSFSVEEAKRFAAAVSDPARMALNFAGVTGNGDDIDNEIVIRGNSSKGLLWRLEGIEIPNPNHFSDLGSGGGSVSMLNASMLSNSDFYTGAFPAEFGNALSGVFDLKLRRGNNEKREHSFQIGTLGIEASSEGYLKKGSKASYLVNYRYSTIALVQKMISTVESEITTFQDFSFKLNIPTKKAGVFSIFGLGGYNSVLEEMQADTSNFIDSSQLQEFTQTQGMGIIGLTHNYVINDNSYLRTSLASSIWAFNDETIELNPEKNFLPEVIDVSDFREFDTAFNMMYNVKLNAKNTVRAGYSLRHKKFDYDFSSQAENNQLLTFLANNGSSQLLDFYVQWKYRISEKWELNSGINISHFFLNNTSGIDPRFALIYQFKPNQSFSISSGLYSKPEHVSTYHIERKNLNDKRIRPNFNLPMLKALHLVGAYDMSLNNGLRFKSEVYYQYLYNIPVGTKPNSFFSTLNTSNVFNLIFNNDLDGAELASEGTGKNYGIDLTLEKSFSRGYYFMTTGSIFDSKFKTLDGREFNTRYATNFVTNLLGGKEWVVGNRSKNIFGLNGKFNYVGGLRTSPILEEESRLTGTTVRDGLRFNDIRRPAYYRLDLGISYKINAKSATHTFSADLQNVTNRKNVAGRFYNPINGEFVTARQNGLIPFINYRIEF